MENEKNWKHLIIAALIGSILTGILQYLALEATYSNDLRKAKIEAQRELLITELSERKVAYKRIREDFVKFYQTQDRDDMAALLLSLQGRLPFFQPRQHTQLRVGTAANSAEVWIRQTNSKKMYESLKELEKSFQADVDRIQKQIDEL